MWKLGIANDSVRELSLKIILCKNNLKKPKQQTTLPPHPKYQQTGNIKNLVRSNQDILSMPSVWLSNTWCTPQWNELKVYHPKMWALNPLFNLILFGSPTVKSLWNLWNNFKYYQFLLGSRMLSFKQTSKQRKIKRKNISLHSKICSAYFGKLRLVPLH